MGIFLLVSSEVRLRDFKKYTDAKMAKLNPSMAESEKTEIFEDVANYLINKKEDPLDYVAIYLGRREDSLE